MNKVLRLLPATMLLVYLLKCLISQSPQLVDAAILATLAALCGYNEFKTEQKDITQLKNDIIELKKLTAEASKKDEELRSHVSSMKLGMNMRTNTLGNRQG